MYVFVPETKLERRLFIQQLRLQIDVDIKRLFNRFPLFPQSLGEMPAGDFDLVGASSSSSSSSSSSESTAESSYSSTSEGDCFACSGAATVVLGPYIGSGDDITIQDACDQTCSVTCSASTTYASGAGGGAYLDSITWEVIETSPGVYSVNVVFITDPGGFPVGGTLDGLTCAETHGASVPLYGTGPNIVCYATVNW